MEEKISGSKGTNKKIFSREIKYRFQMPFAKCHAEKREFEIENVKCQGKIEREKREYEMPWKKKF